MAWPFDADPNAAAPMSLLAPAQVGALATGPAGPYPAPAVPLTSGDAGVAAPPAMAAPGITAAGLDKLGKQMQGKPEEFAPLQTLQAAPQNSGQSAQIAAAIARAYGFGGLS